MSLVHRISVVNENLIGSLTEMTALSFMGPMEPVRNSMTKTSRSKKKMRDETACGGIEIPLAVLRL
jgi:hypothetical protein